nr:MAG TPA: hypothetical protein [Caudoviricetes sp.]
MGNRLAKTLDGGNDISLTHIVLAESAFSTAKARPP